MTTKNVGYKQRPNQVNEVGYLDRVVGREGGGMGRVSDDENMKS